MNHNSPRDEIYRYPRLAYNSGRLDEDLNLRTMTVSSMLAFMQGVLIFALAFRTIYTPVFLQAAPPHPTSALSTLYQSTFSLSGNGLIDSSGRAATIYTEGFYLFTLAIIAMQYRVLAITRERTILIWGLVLLSMIGYLLFTYLYGLFPQITWFDTIPLVLNRPVFWVSVLLVPFAIAVCDFLVDNIMSFFCPLSSDKFLAQLPRNKL
jgi:Phospholipid-translocating P-type ATPase C-terminal